MEITDFIKNVAAQFDETEPSEFQIDTRYKELEEWSSLTALSIIAMVDEEYEVNIKGDDIRNTNTIGELFAVVKSKLPN